MKIQKLSYRFKRKLLLMAAPMLSDEIFLKCLYKMKFGRPLNLDAPQSFNEKLQWLKLHDRRSEYSMMVDKAEVKKYVASIIGEEHIIPTLAVYNRVEEIDFDALPNQFVLKCTHDSGGIVICKDKETLDRKAAIKKLKKGLKTNYFYQNREWVYKNVRPRIIAEQYMTNDSKSTVDELSDYKFFCFDGEPKFLFVATGRQQNDCRFDFFDLEWNHLPVLNGHPNADFHIPMPDNFLEMIEVARKLSQSIPHVRVDLYNVKGKIYFGEMTFFHWSGMTPFEPKDWDYKFGEYLQLPQTEK